MIANIRLSVAADSLAGMTILSTPLSTRKLLPYENAGDVGAPAGRGKDAGLDHSLLAQAFRLVGLDPAQRFEQVVGVLAQERRTADRDR